MNIEQAATQARQATHGSRNHQNAMIVLYQGFLAAHPSHQAHITLDMLWSWVSTQLMP